MFIAEFTPLQTLKHLLVRKILAIIMLNNQLSNLYANTKSNFFKHSQSIVPFVGKY